MSIGEAIGILRRAFVAVVMIIFAISVILPLIMYLITGDLDYWADAFVGAVVPWWVGLPGLLIVIVILAFAALDIEEFL